MAFGQYKVLMCNGGCVLVLVCVLFPHSLAADIVESRLESAKQVGADVVINCAKQKLRDVGMF